MRHLYLIWTFFSVMLSVTAFGQGSISYNTNNIFTLGVKITDVQPTVSPAAGIAAYTVSPAVPDGLTLDPATGKISGTPTKVTPLTIYRVTGTGAGGVSLTASLAITVANPDYDPPVVTLHVDTEMKVIKPASPITHVKYEIKNTTPKVKGDRIPDGLQLDPTTGVISGNPSTASGLVIYQIDATDIVSQVVIATYYVGIAVITRPDAVQTPATITFVGQGDLQQSLNNGAKIAANTGIGVIFRQNSNKHFGILHDIEVELSLNVASTVDTLKSINKGSLGSSVQTVTNKQDFGNSVLLPLNSGQALSFNFKGYFTRRGGATGNFRRNESPKPLGGFLSGFNISLNGSNRNWQYVDTIKGVSPTMVKTSLLSLYIGPFYEFYASTSSTGYNRDISITLGAGYSARWILGDVQQSNQADFRTKLLGTTKNSFNGTEVVLALRFYGIKAEAHLPFFSNKTSVSGSTGTHLTTLIGFSGGFPIDLKKPTKSGS